MAGKTMAKTNEKLSLELLNCKIDRQNADIGDIKHDISDLKQIIKEMNIKMDQLLQEKINVQGDAVCDESEPIKDGDATNLQKCESGDDGGSSMACSQTVDEPSINNKITKVIPIEAVNDRLELQNSEISELKKIIQEVNVGLKNVIAATMDNTETCYNDLYLTIYIKVQYGVPGRTVRDILNIPIFRVPKSLSHLERSSLVTNCEGLFRTAYYYTNASYKIAFPDVDQKELSKLIEIYNLVSLQPVFNAEGFNILPFLNGLPPSSPSALTIVSYSDPILCSNLSVPYHPLKSYVDYLRMMS